MLDLFNGTQGSVTVVEDSVALQGGAIVWSADGNQLALTVAHDPCSQNWTHSIIQVDIVTLTAVSLLDKDDHRFITLAWPAPDQLLLQDMAEQSTWQLDLTSGELSLQN